MHVTLMAYRRDELGFLALDLLLNGLHVISGLCLLIRGVIFRCTILFVVFVCMRHCGL